MTKKMGEGAGRAFRVSGWVSLGLACVVLGAGCTSVAEWNTTQKEMNRTKRLVPSAVEFRAVYRGRLVDGVPVKINGVALINVSMK